MAATAELDEKLRFVQNATGSIMSPMVAWLTLQGVKTLSVRMDRQSASAMAIAQFLSGHPAVGEVCYPGLESFAQHDLAGRQASGFGAMLWCELKGGLEAGKALMDNVELWTLAEKPGGGRIADYASGHDDACRRRARRTASVWAFATAWCAFPSASRAPEDLIEALDAALSRL